MKNIAIIGMGPAGSALAILLAEKGMKVTIFDDGRKPDLIVGESLIPALVPVLRRMGVEERVAKIGVRKPGVSFVLSTDSKIDFCFDGAAACRLPTYSYNVPRPAFDRILEERAIEVGAIRVACQAGIEADGPDGLRLTAETLAAAPSLEGKQPDLIVDATGRRRLFGRALGIETESGPRTDVAYFAHFTGFDPEEPRGQVQIGRMAAGWSWQIPLPERMSVGIVLNKNDAAKFGNTPEERLENAIKSDPVLSVAGRASKRITEVATYSNYQLVSSRASGTGWTMVGDAFGFVDPMLSPGMWLALRSAEMLADRLDDLSAYSALMTRHIKAWMELISYYYDGRMFSMYFTGIAFEKRFNWPVSRFMHRYVDRHIACMASGGTTDSNYGRGMLQFLARYFIRGFDPAALAIR